MNRQGGGAIVNASSILGVVGAPGTHAYVATKAAVANLSRSVALEQLTNDIRVNATCPAAIDTPMNERTVERGDVPRERLEMMQPIGRMETADEVANAVLWLCSDAASYVTGHTLYWTAVSWRSSPPRRLLASRHGAWGYPSPLPLGKGERA